MAEKVYTGERQGEGRTASPHVSVIENGESRLLPPRLDLREHSINLEWGYGIGGPAQLALAILADTTGSDDYAMRHHHWFKLEIISKLPWRGWQLSESQVWDWINEHHPL